MSAINAYGPGVVGRPPAEPTSNDPRPYRWPRASDDTIRAIAQAAQSRGFTHASVPVDWLANLFAELELLRRQQTYDHAMIMAGIASEAREAWEQARIEDESEVLMLAHLFRLAGLA